MCYQAVTISLATLMNVSRILIPLLGLLALSWSSTEGEWKSCRREVGVGMR